MSYCTRSGKKTLAAQVEEVPDWQMVPSSVTLAGIPICCQLDTAYTHRTWRDSQLP